ncbi:helix-turn-helix domain-containing protein [Chamaesiphon polymorphus]|uniref:AraC family transcriptional regulator n=1 Tax=Chamaesiphon polymorphus CCALA 037 TaxID=2107692 RepID=A0A2T1GAJ3_9CYAN|nr:helix-turn-helix domain-containing protein [Chamaesiphon polymorphus]PSB54261.1 AraC family transcriptional regulator [Chamaesiphon polymorphus CCALA 037]
MKPLAQPFPGKIASHQSVCTSQPLFSSQTQGWEHILVEKFHHPAGEGKMLYPNEHAICLSLTPRPVRLLHIQGDKSYTGLYGKGDLSIAPAATPFFARWDSDDRILQMRIDSQFMTQVATEALAMNPDRLEVIPTFRTRDPQLEAIAMLVLTELKQENLGNRLYIDSLANVLAVRLLRQYSASKPQLAVYAGGLPPRQLQQVLEYIDAHLEREIELTDLAGLIRHRRRYANGMSQFHFSHLFKQSIGTSPYQYLLQQRIERAKQLLKQTDRSIVDIALECGFNSHSHLSKQFRQLTGMTPKRYRSD